MVAEPVRELIDAYSRGPDLIEAALRHVSGDELRFTPGPEHWSIHENIIHLVDTEVLYAARLRCLLAEPAKIPVSFRGYDWSRAMDYRSQPLSDALALFRSLRQANTALLRTLSPETWGKTGVHWEQDGAAPHLRTITVAQAVEAFAEHVQYHLRTITKRRAQYLEAERAPR